MHESNSDEGQEQARDLLHELANDLAAIQVRADLLLATTARPESATASLMHADLVVLRALAAHATATVEQFALVIVKAQYSAIDSQDA